MRVKLSVRKWAYIKHVRNHNSQNAKIRYTQDLYDIVCVVRSSHLRLFIAKGFLSSGTHNLTVLPKSRLFRIYFIKNRPCVGFFMRELLLCCVIIIIRPPHLVNLLLPKYKQGLIIQRLPK
jgi:hypothetical protein